MESLEGKKAPAFTLEGSDGKKKFVPSESFMTGPGVDEFLMGVPVPDGMGGKAVATPSIVTSGPFPVDSFLKGREGLRAASVTAGGRTMTTMLHYIMLYSAI